MLALDEDRRRTGVVAASQGNHGLGVAWAAARTGVPATVYLPLDVQRTRAAALAELGCSVVLDGESWGRGERARDRGGARVGPVLRARVRRSSGDGGGGGWETWRHERLLVEPAAACVIAALAAGRIRATSGDRVVAVMCGANLELEELFSWSRAS